MIKRLKIEGRGAGNGSHQPEPVEDRPVRVQTDHSVLHGDAVHEGLLVVQEVGIGDPQLIRHPVVQGQVQRYDVVRQPLIPPRLLKVHGQGVVLGLGTQNRVCTETDSSQTGKTKANPPLFLATVLKGKHFCSDSHT